MRQEQPRTLNQEQRRLLGFMGWEHGKPLNEVVRGMLGWHFGTRGETKDKEGRMMRGLIPGKSVFMVHPRVMANWIMFYIDGRVSRQDLMAVRMDYSVIPVVEAKQQVEQVRRQARVEGQTVV
jgi:hypothetical protein